MLIFGNGQSKERQELNATLAWMLMDALNKEHRNPNDEAAKAKVAIFQAHMPGYQTRLKRPLGNLFAVGTGLAVGNLEDVQNDFLRAATKEFVKLPWDNDGPYTIVSLCAALGINPKEPPKIIVQEEPASQDAQSQEDDYTPRPDEPQLQPTRRWRR